MGGLYHLDQLQGHPADFAVVSFGRAAEHDAMSGQVQFYFDYLSPYAFLAFSPVRELCARLGVSFEPKPILLAGLLNHFGQRGPAEIPPKARFVLMDCARRAKAAGVPFRCPEYHPFRPLTALRASLPEVAGELQNDVIETLFRFGWQQGGDLGDEQAISGALAAAGLDAQLVDKTRQPSIKALLKQRTEEARDAGVFGVPTMLVGGELYWGYDQLAFVEDALTHGDTISHAEILEMMPKGSRATR